MLYATYSSPASSVPMLQCTRALAPSGGTFKHAFPTLRCQWLTCNSLCQDESFATVDRLRRALTTLGARARLGPALWRPCAPPRLRQTWAAAKSKMAGQQEAKSGKLTVRASMHAWSSMQRHVLPIPPFTHDNLLPLNQIAIEGCCHGDLDNIYGTLQHLERVEGKKIDLLICCGDFQVCMCHWEGETLKSSQAAFLQPERTGPSQA